MLLTIALVLLVTWLVGVLGAYDIGSLVHVPLLVGLMLLLLALVKAREPVTTGTRPNDPPRHR